MPKIKAKVVRLSICACGEPVLDESIGLGAEYEIDPETIRGGFSYFCGGCRTTQKQIVIVEANQKLHPERPPAPLPLALFEELPSHA